ncbi:hypothetical protein GGR57DRAFT_462787 [Xylariaceae sp. FL1272]|nr:hypothetical protein GGR57DRAFT_462787 [Xylariaceae sp. FL1272]
MYYRCQGSCAFVKSSLKWLVLHAQLCSSQSVVTQCCRCTSRTGRSSYCTFPFTHSMSCCDQAADDLTWQLLARNGRSTFLLQPLLDMILRK